MIMSFVDIQILIVPLTRYVSLASRKLILNLASINIYHSHLISAKTRRSAWCLQCTAAAAAVQSAARVGIISTGLQSSVCNTWLRIVADEKMRGESIALSSWLMLQNMQQDAEKHWKYLKWTQQWPYILRKWTTRYLSYVAAAVIVLKWKSLRIPQIKEDWILYTNYLMIYLMRLSRRLRMWLLKVKI